MHEPPTKRSWYTSVATSTLRAIILIAAIVIGIVVLKGAFPENSSQGITNVLPSHSPTPSPSSVATPSTSPSPSTRRPKVKGVTVQVLNGTSTTGLASIVTGELNKAGYSMKAPGNVKSATHTTIYYRPGFKPQAEFLQEKHFSGAVVAPAPSTFPAGIDLTVVLGTDFAASSSP